MLLPLALCACADLNHLSGGKTCGTRRGVDLRTDAQNCGACGHDCLGGACIDGACQPAVLASGLQQPTAIAVDGCANMVFWTNQTKVNPQGGTVMSCSTDVGTCAQTPTTIAVAEQQPFAIAIDADYVYFSTIAGFGTVRQCRRDVGCTGTGAIVWSGPPMPPSGPPEIVQSLFSDGSYVYWATYSSRIIERCPSGSGASCKGGQPIYEPLMGNAPFQTPWGVVADDKAVYWTGDNGVYWCPKTGCAVPNLLAGLEGNPNVTQRPLAIAGVNLYWAEDADPGIVWSASTSMGPKIDVADGQQNPAGVASDATYVYWTDSGSGTIMRASIGDAGAPTVLASGQNDPQGIAVDDTAIYWAAGSDKGNDGVIMKLAK